MVADLNSKADGKTKRDLIVEFVIKHDGCTQTAIIDYMAQTKKEKSPLHAASETTRNELRKLKDEKDDEGNAILTIIKDPKNSQIHHYHIHNKFSIIYKELDKIDNFIIMWDNPIHRINSDYGIYPVGSIQQLPGIQIKRDFVFSYYETIRTKLYLLLDQLAILKLSEKNAQTLFKMIMKLIEKLSEQIMNDEIKDSKRMLIHSRNELLKSKKCFESYPIGLKYFNPKMHDDLIKSIDDFDKQFLS
jgi:hypothetical protein